MQLKDYEYIDGKIVKAHKKNKWSAKSTTVDGINFASQKEAKRYSYLAMLQRQGLIKNLKLQPYYTFQLNGNYIKTPKGKPLKAILDFEYEKLCAGKCDWQLIVEDVKGKDNRLSQLKRELVRVFHRVEVVIV